MHNSSKCSGTTKAQQAGFDRLSILTEEQSKVAPNHQDTTGGPKGKDQFSHFATEADSPPLYKYVHCYIGIFTSSIQTRFSLLLSIVCFTSCCVLGVGQLARIEITTHSHNSSDLTIWFLLCCCARLCIKNKALMSKSHRIIDNKRTQCEQP